MLQINTYSIVAYDAQERAWGVAVASKFLAAGALVSWARADAGAIATQALAKVGYGPQGLALLAEGKDAQTVLNTLLADDPKREQRQVGIVDANGNAAAHTGRECMEWAGHRTGKGYTCQGNILTGQETINAMATAYEKARGELADRLLTALQAGDTAGGDKRGKQAAAVLVVRPNGGYGGDTDRYLDLRVDDDETPVKKLKRLVASHHLFFGKPRDEDRIQINKDIARELQQIMLEQGYLGGEVNGDWDIVSQQAFWNLIGNENLEERWSLESEPGVIDRVALDYLRERFK
jgi:uncharacterized Ntn-hydrolase superfamily protein